MSQVPDTDTPTTWERGEREKEELREVIKEFLFQCEPQFSVGLQKLCFYADLYCAERWGRRLLTVDYKAYMYGAYSESINEALHQLVEEDPALFTVPAKRHGKLSKKYGSETGSDSIASGKQKVVEWTCRKTEGMDLPKLTDISKKNSAYRYTKTGDVIDFRAHKERIDEGEIEPDLWSEEKPDDFPQDHDVEDLHKLL